MNVIVKRAVVGGAVSTLIMAIGTYVLGEVSGYEAMELLTTSLSGINMLCNTVILGSSTILALMLTLLSLSRAAKSKLSKAHYYHVLIIAKVDTILIIAAIVTFLMLNLPITETHNVPSSWFNVIYYTSLGMAAILGGGFIAVVTMLYGTIANVIHIVGFKETDHPLVESNDDEAEAIEEKQKEMEKDVKNVKENSSK